MFQEVEREFSMARWIWQLLIVYCGPTMLVGLSESPFRKTDSPIWQASDYLLIALLGLWAGIGVRRLAPDSTREGAWVWLLPTAVLVAGVLYDMFSGARDFQGFFFYPGPGDPDPCPVLLTLPTWGCGCYSA